MRIIDKLVEQWYRDMDCKTPIHDYIGLTLAEYDDFKNHGAVPLRRPELAQNFNKSDTPVVVGSFVLEVTPAKREV